MEPDLEDARNMTDNPNQNAVNALNQISLQLAQQTKTINNVFPQFIGTAASVTSGGIIPLNLKGYATVNLPGIGTVKLGYYGD